MLAGTIQAIKGLGTSIILGSGSYNMPTIETISAIMARVIGSNLSNFASPFVVSINIGFLFSCLHAMYTE